jgi:PIN domain nuclease of toxin-antitoxin system
MILLDTNALLWVHRGHRRARRLGPLVGRLYASPASLLEIQLLVEVGRIRLRPGAGVADVVTDDRWMMDDPPSASWFDRALEIGWTRDPFDRLLVAHARLRGWRVATGDGDLIERLGPAGCLEL